MELEEIYKADLVEVEQEISGSTRRSESGSPVEKGLYQVELALLKRKKNALVQKLRAL